MAQFSTQNAEPVRDDGGTVVGFILQHTPELWLPLDASGENLTGPTYKADAVTIVRTMSAPEA